MRSVNELLNEVSKAKQELAKMLGLPSASNKKEVDKKVGNEEEDEKQMSQSEEVRLAKGLMRSVIQRSRLHPKKTSDKKEGDSFISRSYVNMGGKEMILKLILLYETKQVSLSLWEDDESTLVDLILLGQIKDHRKLERIGVDRLKQYL